MGESVSSIITYHEAQHINSQDLETWDTIAFRLENRLKKLIEKLELKKKNKDWDDGTVT